MRAFNKDAFVKLGLVILSFAISGLVGEFALRIILKDNVLYPRYHTAAQYGEFRIRRLRPDSVFWHTSIDGSWKFITNSAGLRNERDYPYHKPPGTLRILSLGDSHTQGFEVRQEYTFSSIIQRYLKKQGVAAEVINAGISGSSTAEELVFLENEGIKYNPDIVVLGFFANDLDDNIKAGLFKWTDDRLILTKKEHLPGVSILDGINRFAVLRWLSENSYLYSVVLNTAWEVAKKALLSEEKARLQTEFAVPTENKVEDYQLRLAGGLMERIYAFCKENGIKLIILDIPREDEYTDDTVQPSQVKSSIPEVLLEPFRTNSDILLHTDDALAEYNSVAELLVPHGQNHISEITHTIYGVLAGRAIMGMISDPRGSASNP